VEDADRTEPLTARSAFVEFGPRFPGKVNKVAGYAVRTVEVDQARTVKLRAGSSDALRVWVNGRLVIETLKLRPAKKDEDEAAVELRPGVNVIVVEVAQMDGDWGFYFRLEDDRGGKLRVGTKGELIPLDAGGKR